MAFAHFLGNAFLVWWENGQDIHVSLFRSQSNLPASLPYHLSGSWSVGLQRCPSRKCGVGASTKKNHSALTRIDSDHFKWPKIAQLCCLVTVVTCHMWLCVFKFYI